MRRAVWGPSIVAACLAGCAPHPGRLLVVVDTDISAEELSTIRVVAGASRERSLALRGERAFTLPLSFVVVPRGGDSDRRVRVVVSGLGPDGRELVVSRSLIAGFIEGETR